MDTKIVFLKKFIWIKINLMHKNCSYRKSKTKIEL